MVTSRRILTSIIPRVPRKRKWCYTEGKGDVEKTRRELIDLCQTFQDTYEDYPFGSPAGSEELWAVMRHRTNKKSFALIFVRDGLCINLKCEPLRADFLRQLYEGVTPGYHMNKTHWNTARIPSDVPEEELYAMIERSFRLTRPKRLPTNN